MNVAELSLCEELYKLSGWGLSNLTYRNANVRDQLTELVVCDGRPYLKAEEARPEDVPAYDLGYLLRKLPRKLAGVNSKQRYGNFNLYASRGKSAWIASYADADYSVVRRLKKGAATQNPRNFWFVHASADTPEDAACKLAIELFKQGILTSQLNQASGKGKE